VLAFLPNLAGYIDRALMYRAMCDEVESVTVAARDSGSIALPEPTPANFTLLESASPRQRSAIAARFVATARRGNLHAVVHENFIGIAFPAAVLKDPRGACHRRVLSLYSPTPTLFLQSARRGIWMRDMSPRAKRHYLGLYLKRLAWEFPSSQLSHLIACNSDEVCQGIIRYYRVSPRKVVVIPTAVDTAHFRPRKVRKTALGLPAKDALLLHVGHMSARKGIYILLKAAALLKSWHVRFRLVCLGGFDRFERQNILHMRASLGLEEEVAFPGSVARADLPLWYSAAELLLCPSISEGSPRTVKEAAACGCPVIASDLPGTRMLDEDGAFMRFVPLNRPDGLAQAMRELLENAQARKLMGESGRRVMQERYTPQHVAQQLMAQYESIWNRERAEA
jgi:glycosyltransferase involved in cell wall biosynthesis